MENITICDNLKDTNFYKGKKFVSYIKKLTDEEIAVGIDSSVISIISGLDIQTINLIFRNSNATMQNKLWKNDRIQRILILGTDNLEKFVCDDKAMRNLENLKKIVKSQTIIDELYTNKYFIYAIIKCNKFRNRFFNNYDINHVFDGVISSEFYNDLSFLEQQKVVEKLNEYTPKMLLPKDFRRKFKNIDRIIFNSHIEHIDSSILEQLTEDEMFFLEYINEDNSVNAMTRKFLFDTVKTKNKSLDEFFEELDAINKLQYDKISRYRGGGYFYGGSKSLTQKAYNILLHECDDEIVKEKLLKYLTCKATVGSTLDVETFYNTLKRNLNNDLLEYSDVLKLTTSYYADNKDLRLAFYQKFNISLNNTTYLNGISVEQILKLNVKHINKLVKFLEDKSQDEITAIYGACIKMYFIFGYERCLEIFNGKYGQYNRTFIDNVSKCDVSKVEMKQEGSKYLPVIDKRFITFMFATPKNNHFTKMLEDKSSELYKNWYYFYNNYDDILEKCHNEITLKKINSILETDKYKVNRKLITPDVYNLNNNDFIENIVLGNKTSHTDDEVLEKIIEIYKEMKLRTESSIPHVDGVSNDGYGYEILKFDDLRIFELGYKANCCIRTYDVAHNHLLYAALCRNGRILVIYDKFGDLAAFSPLKRNGNVLIANSIECIDKKYNVTGKLISGAFKEALLETVMISKESDEPIDLVCIGRNAYLKPEVESFPEEYPTPTIFEKDDEIYKKTDTYHKSLDIVYKDKKFKFSDIISKDPEVSYMDPRDEVKCIDFKNEREKVDSAINVINSINYSLDSSEYTPIDGFLISKAYYNKDWFIAESYHGIISCCLDNDYRAREEFNTYMNMVNGVESPKVFKKEISE